MGATGAGRLAEAITHCDVTYEENVIYGEATKVRCRDSGSPRHAINCRACSL
jgi:hypothetical protein